MTGTRINRRLVLIAFIVAVLLGAGSQAVALWSQSSNVTMQVTAGNLPAPKIECPPKGGSDNFKMIVTWGDPSLVSASFVKVSKGGTELTKGYRILSPTSLELQGQQMAIMPGDTIAIAVSTKNSNGWTSETAVLTVRAVDDHPHVGWECVS